MNIGDALFTKTQQSVLSLLFGKPDRRYYLNEVIGAIGMGRGTVQRELSRLTDAGILTRTVQGKQSYYQVNQQAPIYTELLGIVRKTFGIVDVMKEALQILNDNIQLAFVYGSIAKSRETESSDVDLMLVGNALAYGEIMELLSEVELVLDRPVNPTIYTPEQFTKKIEEGASFVTRVLSQPKLMIKGEIDDFRKPI